jgi:hypothetical protein
MVSSEDTEFGDACLGVTREGVTCALDGTAGHLRAQGAGFHRRPVYISAIM